MRPKVGRRAAKWLIKKSLNKLYILFRCFIATFDKETNIHCSSASILRPIYSRDHSATNQAINWTDTKAISENVIIFFLENNEVQ